MVKKLGDKIEVVGSDCLARHRSQKELGLLWKIGQEVDKEGPGRCKGQSIQRREHWIGSHRTWVLTLATISVRKESHSDCLDKREVCCSNIQDIDWNWNQERGTMSGSPLTPADPHIDWKNFFFLAFCSFAQPQAYFLVSSMDLSVYYS